MFAGRVGNCAIPMRTEHQQSNMALEHVSKMTPMFMGHADDPMNTGSVYWPLIAYMIYAGRWVVNILTDWSWAE